ncbi:MAG: prepilin peptidase [Bacilli bacterium]|nr:prepilin peptidase [Bacilli bacterium]
MQTYYLIIAFIMGTIFGSFYNVVGYRLSTGGSLTNPKKSYCPKCKKELKWYELFPIISYLIQGGKCRKCHKKISFFYPFTEAVTGLLFMVSYYSFGISLDLIIALSICSFLMIVIVSDVNYLIIPDEVTIFFSILIIIVKFIDLGFKGGMLAIGSGLLLLTVMYLIMLLGNFMFKKESMGGGDIKLMFVVGLVLHPVVGLFVIFLSSLIALPVSAVIYIVNKNNVIPFGPFILISLVLLFMLKVDINSIYNIFNLLK